MRGPSHTVILMAPLALCALLLAVAQSRPQFEGAALPLVIFGSLLGVVAANGATQGSPSCANAIDSASATSVPFGAEGETARPGVSLIQTTASLKLLERATGSAQDSMEITSVDEALQGKKGDNGAPERRIANTSITIAAPAEVIWKVLVTGIADWKSWNDVFDADISGPTEVGTKFKIKTRFGDKALIKNTVTPMVLTELDVDRLVCWEMKEPLVVPAVLWARHCHRLSEAAGGAATLVENWEDQGGSMANLVENMMGDAVREGFELWNQALREECERLANNP